MVLAFCRRGSAIPICIGLLVGRNMKQGINTLKNQSTKKKRTGFLKRMKDLLKRMKDLLKRISQITLIPSLLYDIHNIHSTVLPNLYLFRHINQGIEEILADHVHQEMTRNLIGILLRVFLIILIKDLVLSILSF